VQDFSKGNEIEKDVSTYGNIKAEPQKLDLSSFKLPDKGKVNPKYSCENVATLLEAFQTMTKSFSAGLKIGAACLAMLWM
jgi:hypothetical protein